MDSYIRQLGKPLTLDWRRLGININGDYITQLRFADDIVVLAETMKY